MAKIIALHFVTINILIIPYKSLRAREKNTVSFSWK